MKKIVLASRNPDKLKEMQALLEQYIDDIEVLSLDDVGITEEIVEDGDTFYDNAMIKARAAVKSGYISLGDDSGLMVAALGGAPGVMSARYAGEHGNDKVNNELLLKNLEGIGNRDAEFVSCIAVAFPDSDGSGDFVVQGTVQGEILLEERGNGGFGYDPLFWYDELGKSFGEMTPEEKNSISHRGQAFRTLAEKLKEIFKDS